MTDPSEQLYKALGIAYDFFNQKLFKNDLPKVIFTVQRNKGILGYFSPDRWGSLNGESCHEIAINPAYLAQCRVFEVLQTLVHEMVHCWQYCHGTPPSNSAYHNKEWALKMKAIGLMPSDTGRPGGAITGQNMSDFVIEGGRFYQASKQLLLTENYQFSWVDRKALPKLFEPRVFEVEDEVRNLRDNVNTDVESLSESSTETLTNESSLSVPWLSDGLELTFGELMPEGFITQVNPKKQTRYRYVCPGCDAKVYGKPRLKLLCMDCNMVYRWGNK